MSNHQRLLAAIDKHVEAEVSAGRIVDANSAAISLSSQYPEIGVTVDEIADLIEQAAVKANGALYSGSRPLSATK